MNGARRLALCADDFGHSLPGAERIAELARRGRLQATSALVGLPAWPQSARLWHDWPASVERGLHFNLTEGVPASHELRRLWPEFPQLRDLLAAAFRRALPLPAIAAEWQCQWEAFVAAAGAPPDFVDGHQHVHQLPGIRGLVLDAAQASDRPVRNTGRIVGPGFALKRLAIRATGGLALQRELRRRGLRHNAALQGAYDFATRDYRALMRGWFAALPAEGSLLFCHPGRAVDGDTIGAAREREAAYLGSEAFAEDLAEFGITTGPVWQRTTSAG